MQLSRRNFLQYCTASAAALGLGRQTLRALGAALRNPNGPKILWLQGAGCTGCSISFLNYISAAPGLPVDAADLLINVVDLAYHPNLMAAAGPAAVGVAEEVYAQGGYLLVIEGGVPTAFGGNTCWAWTDADGDVTFHEAVVDLASRAAAIVCVGTCSSFGGIPAAGSNPTGVQSVSQVTGVATINIPGCPPHPDWVVHVVAEFIAGNPIPLDVQGRPLALYSRRVHQDCPLRYTPEATQWGQEGNCKDELGCRGKETWAVCPSSKFNNGTNWCIGAGASCLGCTEPSFPGTEAFFEWDD